MHIMKIILLIRKKSGKRKIIINGMKHILMIRKNILTLLKEG